MALSRKPKDKVGKKASSPSPEELPDNQLRQASHTESERSNDMIRRFENELKWLIQSDSPNLLASILNEILKASKDKQDTYTRLFSSLYHLHFVLSEVRVSIQEENIDPVYNSLRFFLHNIREIEIDARRELLNELANYVNEFFTDFKFVSPEQSLLVDPKIHHADGMNSQEVKKGVSFAVLNKATMNTLRYASIEVK